MQLYKSDVPLYGVMSNFAIFGFYLENCKRQVFNVNCEIDQHDKFYLPANVQQNQTTGVGVMAPEMSVFTYSCIFGYYLEIYRRQKVNLNCKYEQHDKVYLPGIGLQVLELQPLKCQFLPIFSFLGYSL